MITDVTKVLVKLEGLAILTVCKEVFSQLNIMYII